MDVLIDTQTHGMGLYISLIGAEVCGGRLELLPLGLKLSTQQLTLSNQTIGSVDIPLQSSS